MLPQKSSAATTAGFEVLEDLEELVRQVPSMARASPAPRARTGRRFMRRNLSRSGSHYKGKF